MTLGLLLVLQKKRTRGQKEDLGNLSNISEGNVSDEKSDNDSEEGESKKQKVEGLEQPDGMAATDDNEGKVESIQSGITCQIGVVPVDPGSVQEHVAGGAQQESHQTC